MRSCSVHIPAPTESDHWYLDVSVLDKLSQGPKPFKYMPFWSQYSDSLRIINEEIEGNDMDMLHIRLKNDRGRLKALNNEEFSNIDTRVIEKGHELECECSN
ncbi:hypothetical protein LIER_08764 [Lithospermum erythrorhizon]|uniref:Uncharacterized protein n=1 Tax=Lithospermum erythrorhizon TaxID=34254 RepID=A0AAV3PH44_LITER